MGNWRRPPRGFGHPSFSCVSRATPHEKCNIRYAVPCRLCFSHIRVRRFSCHVLAVEDIQLKCVKLCVTCRLGSDGSDFYREFYIPFMLSPLKILIHIKCFLEKELVDFNWRYIFITKYQIFFLNIISMWFKYRKVVSMFHEISNKSTLIIYFNVTKEWIITVIHATINTTFTGIQ